MVFVVGGGGMETREKFGGADESIMFYLPRSVQASGTTMGRQETIK
jgi:hypothetical protein